MSAWVSPPMWALAAPVGSTLAESMSMPSSIKICFWRATSGWWMSRSVKSVVDHGFWIVSASGAPLTIGVQKGLSEPSSLNCLSVPCSV